MDTFEQRLRAARKQAGATQGHWASLAGIEQSGYARWEKGETRPSFEKLGALCRAVRLCPLCLIYGPQHRRWRHLRGEYGD